MSWLLREVAIAERLTGDEWLHFYAMVVEDGTIRQLMPATCLPADIEREEFEDCSIAPAFIDIQIYGAFGRLFSVYPNNDSLIKLGEYCEQGGAAYFLPTVATNTQEVVRKSIDAVREYWSMGGHAVPGLHLEGPWINPIKRGAHIEQLIHSPSGMMLAITERWSMLAPTSPGSRCSSGLIAL